MFQIRMVTYVWNLNNSVKYLNKLLLLMQIIISTLQLPFMHRVTAPRQPQNLVDVSDLRIIVGCVSLKQK